MTCEMHLNTKHGVNRIRANKESQCLQRSSESGGLRVQEALSPSRQLLPSPPLLSPTSQTSAPGTTTLLLFFKVVLLCQTLLFSVCLSTVERSQVLSQEPQTTGSPYPCQLNATVSHRSSVQTPCECKLGGGGSAGARDEDNRAQSPV